MIHLLTLLPLLTLSQAPASQSGFPGLALAVKPRVEIAWNRFYDAEGIHELLDRLEAQWPDLLTHEVIGRSIEGRELRVYSLTDPSTGPAADKPAMWVDANVHGNEVQGAEACVYLLWYLLENHGGVERVDRLLERCAFYVLPMVNPDGRAHWFAGANDAHSSRTGVAPTDNDRDGRYDEDGPDDLDGDGHIVQMRKYGPGEGTHRLDPDDPRRMVWVGPNDLGIRGDWILLGEEGLDNDGDGRVNEDSLGGYDMNRAWPAAWQPGHVQYGAGPYPLYWPETRTIASFLYEHPNIAALQSFHNAGGMILRGPGAEVYGEYERADLAVFDELGRDGEKMLPFYRYMILWKDLYSVFGGFATWGYEGLGIISFTNELWNQAQRYPDGRGDGGQAGSLFFDDALLLGEGFVDWHPAPAPHEVYGDIELGGFRKDVGRVPPTFLIEEMIHRNALFCVKHAEAMPDVRVASVAVEPLGDGLSAVDVVFRNERPIPTRTARAATARIGEPDLLTLESGQLEVLAGGPRSARLRPQRFDFVERDPARLVREHGLPGRGEVRVRWIVRGSGVGRIGWSGRQGRDVFVPVQVE